MCHEVAAKCCGRCTSFFESAGAHLDELAFSLSVVLSCTVLQHDSGTHHPPSSTHKLSQRIPQPAGCQDPSEELIHLIMLRNTIPLSVTHYTLVLLWTTPHVLSVPIPVHMPLQYSTLYDLHPLSLRTCSR